jgi:hypothetical protein
MGSVVVFSALAFGMLSYFVFCFKDNNVGKAGMNEVVKGILVDREEGVETGVGVRAVYSTKTDAKPRGAKGVNGVNGATGAAGMTGERQRLLG